MKGNTKTTRHNDLLHALVLLLMLAAVLVLPMQAKAATFGLESIASNSAAEAGSGQVAFNPSNIDPPVNGTEVKFGPLALPGAGNEATLYTGLTFSNEWSGAVNGGVTTMNFDCHPVPIPSAVWLLGSGLLGLVGFRGKFKK
jgi:hypothetical protein